jgi:hypothetical protein
MTEYRVQWNDWDDEYFIDIPIGNQTLHMAFQEYDWNLDTVYFNVYMTLYNKKTQIQSNEDNIRSTGLNPLATYSVAMKAFKKLEAKTLAEFNDRYDIVIFCTWLDRRRRDVYYKVLSRLGYRYGRNIDNEKCIYKKFKKGSIFND